MHDNTLHYHYMFMSKKINLTFSINQSINFISDKQAVK